MSALLRWGFDRKAGAKKRPVPLVRAYTGPWPILTHRTMAEVMRDEALALRQAQGERVEKEAKPRVEHAATVEIEGYRASAGVEAQGGQICEPCVEPASRLGTRRRVPATSEIIDVTAGETAPESKQAAVMPVQPASVPMAVEGRDPPPAPSPSVRAHDHDDRAVMVRKAPAPVDWGRVAYAARARPVAPPKRKPAPTVMALSREACVRCGVPGWRGCDHQLPYEEAK